LRPWTDRLVSLEEKAIPCSWSADPSSAYHPVAPPLVLFWEFNPTPFLVMRDDLQGDGVSCIPFAPLFGLLDSALELTFVSNESVFCHINVWSIPSPPSPLSKVPSRVFCVGAAGTSIGARPLFRAPPRRRPPLSFLLCRLV